MTSSPVSTLRAWPVSALAVWAAARAAGRCAPDDVLHTLHDYSQAHELDGLMSGDVLDLLDVVSGNAHLAVRMPSPGDAQGLPPGTPDGAEVLLIDDRPLGSEGPTAALALTARGTAERCRWELSRVPTPLAVDRLSSDLPLGELEYELREAVGEAAQLIAGLSGARASSPADLRDALAALTEARRIDLPPHEHPRVDRVITSAAQIDAIIDLAGVGALGVSGAQTDVADHRLRRLTALTRTARTAAINTLITDYRR
ncbi:serine/threonine protein kinase [Gordonia spumicola]|uniref:serine/threonine protein kinase n=1 Tax=Gordonia spumicola TaxID=589161 RepID=UPI00137B5039|nr:serine/threonine protein kinase [Gordonia spumicola]